MAIILLPKHYVPLMTKRTTALSHNIRSFKMETKIKFQFFNIWEIKNLRLFLYKNHTNANITILLLL